MIQMKAEDLIAEIESLRAKMVEFYLTDDLENAIKTSQLLDQKIYSYLMVTQGKIN